MCKHINSTIVAYKVLITRNTYCKYDQMTYVSNLNIMVVIHKCDTVDFFAIFSLGATYRGMI
jgi:hypothetical protein